MSRCLVLLLLALTSGQATAFSRSPATKIFGLRAWVERVSQRFVSLRKENPEPLSDIPTLPESLHHLPTNNTKALPPEDNALNMASSHSNNSPLLLAEKSFSPVQEKGLSLPSVFSAIHTPTTSLSIHDEILPTQTAAILDQNDSQTSNAVGHREVPELSSFPSELKEAALHADTSLSLKKSALPVFASSPLPLCEEEKDIPSAPPLPRQEKERQKIRISSRSAVLEKLPPPPLPLPPVPLSVMGRLSFPLPPDKPSATQEINLTVMASPSPKVQKKEPFVARPLKTPTAPFLMAPTMPPIDDVAFFSLLYLHQLCGKFVVMDVESTGLGKDDKITELGGFVIQGLQITGEKFQAFVNPEREVSSSAYQLTGYTRRFLSQYPVFGRVAPRFLTFIKSAALVMHNAPQDVKWINEGLKQSGNDYGTLEKKHVIIDTLPFAQTLHPKAKNNLTDLCHRHGIDTTQRHYHGALIDAKLLAEVFLKMIRKNKSLFPSNVLWEHLSRVDFYKDFDHAAGTAVEDTFRKMGIKLPLPFAFRYTPSLYHPQLQDHYPASLIVFSHRHTCQVGVLARYFVPDYVMLAAHHNTPLAPTQKKIFFGTAEDAFVNLYIKGLKTVFIGSLLDALVARDALLGPSASKIQSYLNIKSAYDFCIKGVLHHHFFATLDPSPLTQEVILLLDGHGRNDTHLSETLSKCVEKYCIKNFITLFKMLEQEPDLTRYIVKFNQQEWTISSDTSFAEERHMVLKKESNYVATMIINLNSKDVTWDDILVTDPSLILVASPRIALKAIVLRKEIEGSMPIPKIARDKPEQIIERMCQPFPIHNAKDLIFIEKVETARRVYEKGQTILNNSPAKKYFEKRGILCDLPSSFRYIPSAYNPWLEVKFPAILVPLFNEKNVLVGLNRTFCDYDGTSLKKQRKTKEATMRVSLGKTVGAVTEIYKGSRSLQGLTRRDSGVVMISEGAENALVVKEAMEHALQYAPPVIENIYTRLGITDNFMIKACVGINGFIDTPLDSTTHTVVLLADNDGVNSDAKQTIINTVDFFLRTHRKVKIALPRAQEGQKRDLNDVYLQAVYAHQACMDKYQEIYGILCCAASIDTIENLGDPQESLQASLDRINRLQKLDDGHKALSLHSKVKSAVVENPEKHLETLKKDSSLLLNVGLPRGTPENKGKTNKTTVNHLVGVLLPKGPVVTLPNTDQEIKKNGILLPEFHREEQKAPLLKRAVLPSRRSTSSVDLPTPSALAIKRAYVSLMEELNTPRRKKF